MPGSGVLAPGVQADVAQLVERNLAKVEVASSSLVVRSEKMVAASVVEWPRGEATDCKSVYTGSNPVSTSIARALPDRGPGSSRAIGAVVARFLDTEEVTGSNPVSPTSTKGLLTCDKVGEEQSSLQACAMHVRSGFLHREGSSA